MTAWYILASTIELAFVAAVWSSKGGLNIILKMITTVLAVFGAICAAAAFGVTP